MFNPEIVLDLRNSKIGLESVFTNNLRQVTNHLEEQSVVMNSGCDSCETGCDVGCDNGCDVGCDVGCDNGCDYGGPASE